LKNYQDFSTWTVFTNLKENPLKCRCNFEILSESAGNQVEVLSQNISFEKLYKKMTVVESS